MTADAEFAERLRQLRFYGFGPEERRAGIEGTNSRLDEMQAAVLRVKLGRLDVSLEERRVIAARYLAGLAGSALELPSESPETRHAFHLFVVQSGRRRALRASLEAAGVGSAFHYPEPVHRMPAYVRLGYGSGDLPVSEAAAERVLSLPIYPGLAHSAIDEVIAALSAAA